MTGGVVLVGAGPGDPDLLTVRAARELAEADVVLYDALIPPAIVGLVPTSCERVDVGKRGDGTRGVSQERIVELMIARARAGARVVRLKGGDPFVFGRGGEECSALREAGIPFEVVPGVSAAIAAPAYAGIPVTDRRYASSFTVVTGHRGKRVTDDRTDWEELARSADTLVVLMGTAWLPDIAARLIAGGRDPETPAAVVASATTGAQRTVRAALREIAQAAREANIRAPAVIVIGAVAALREALAWYEARPLFGRHILHLRAPEASAELALALARAGAIPVHVPLLVIEPPADGGAALRAALARGPDFDWIVLTSAATVRQCARSAADVVTYLRDVLPSPAPADAALPAPPRTPSGPRIACIGAATATAARDAGWPVHVAPDTGGPEALTRVLAPVAGQRLLIPRSELADDALPRALQEQGAKVECVTAYRNVLPEGAATALHRAVEGDIDAVVVTSPSTVRRLHELLGATGLEALAQRAAFVCIGTTSLAATRALGITPRATAEEPSAAGIVSALEAALSSSTELAKRLQRDR
jgi:uroporphyrinogen III methyltransferase/synthase